MTAKRKPARRKLTTAEVVAYGRRQPALQLPTDMPSGVTTQAHPLVWLLTHQMPEDTPKIHVAYYMGVRPQALYKWEAACRVNRNFPLPAKRAHQLATYFGVSPKLLRPDIF